VGMVRDYQVEAAREEINKKVNELVPLYQIHGKTTGAYQRIQDLLPHILKTVELQPGQVIRIKLEGDGRKVGRTKKQAMMSFCVLQEGKKVMQPSNHHVLSIIVGGESYEELFGSLGQLFSDLGSLAKDGIWVDHSTGALSTTQSQSQRDHEHDPDHPDHQHHSVELLFSSDWKFMATVLGINAANSTFPCLWCLCQHKDLSDMHQAWHTTRTLVDALRYLQNKIKNVRSHKFLHCLHCGQKVKKKKKSTFYLDTVWLPCEDPAAHGGVRESLPRPLTPPHPRG